MTILNLKLNKASKLINFLKRFQSIDNSLLLEISDGEIKAKSHTPEKSVVKYAAVPLDEIFSEYSDITEDIKFGIYNIKKFADSCKFFGETDFEMNITCDTLNGETVGTTIVLKNSALNIEFQCAGLKLFTYISDDVLTNKVMRGFNSPKVEFVLPKEQQAKLSSLFSIEDYSKVTFLKKGKTIQVKGKSFDLVVLEDNNLKSIDNCSLSIFKQHYAFIDNEDADVYITGDTIIFVSKESDTKMIVGEAQD